MSNKTASPSNLLWSLRDLHRVTQLTLDAAQEYKFAPRETVSVLENQLAILDRLIEVIEDGLWVPSSCLFCGVTGVHTFHAVACVLRSEDRTHEVRAPLCERCFWTEYEDARKKVINAE